ENVSVDYVLRLSEIASKIIELAHQAVEVEQVGAAMPEEMAMEAKIAELDPAALHDNHRPGKPSVFACPECGGSLFELHDDELVRFRCRVGHAFSSGSLLSQQSSAVEEALWTAMRALEESAALTDRMAERARKRKDSLVAERYAAQSSEAIE